MVVITILILLLEKKQKRKKNETNFPFTFVPKFIALMFTSCIEPRPKHPQENLQALNYTNLLQDFFSEYLLQSGDFYHFSFNLSWQRTEILRQKLLQAFLTITALDPPTRVKPGSAGTALCQQSYVLCGDKSSENCLHYRNTTPCKPLQFISRCYTDLGIPVLSPPPPHRYNSCSKVPSSKFIVRGCYPGYRTSTYSDLSINGKLYLTSSNRLFISPTSRWFSCSNCKREKKKKVLLEFTGLDSVNFAQPPAPIKQPSLSFTKISKDDYHQLQ